ncbi:MAG: peptide chain release factor 1 [Candidatus Acetothermia bacterium]
MVDILDEMDQIEEKFQELEQLMGNPDVIDSQRYQKVSQNYAKLKKILKHAGKIEDLNNQIQEDKSMLETEEDPEMIELIEQELQENKEAIDKHRQQIEQLLLPSDPSEEKNAIIEIRAGTGGDESALFAADLLRLYQKYAEKRGWEIEPLDSQTTSIGGFKQVTVAVEGKGVFGQLKYESGVHRVQRVPETESSGRIHTSTATVAVLPEAEEIEVEIDPNNVRVDTFRSSGPGGQHANVTESAVRLTHEPTGIVVSCQDESSQHKNKKKAWRVLRSRVKEKLEEQKSQKRDSQRRGQIGKAQRSEKIRTYNFPQNRVTDHRISYTTHNLEGIMEGEIDELIDKLAQAEEEEKLENFEIDELLKTAS